MRKVLVLLMAALAMLAAPVVVAARDKQAPLVLAAASLQESMNAAADAWSAKGHPRPRISFAGSSALARQIEAGAPADLFVSADEPWMDELEGKKLLKAGTRVSFLRNTLVLIAPRSSTTKLTIRPGMPLAKALGSGRLSVADPAGVPAGIYAQQALTRLDVWNSVKTRLAPVENVRAALALVSRGAAPLGIVYGTDARADPSVRVVGMFPQTSHDPISYPVALLAASKNPEAEGFRRFLISGEGKAVFRRFGFGTK
ncbi:molybdate ABC transporter substrate-binding protein [Novosphingobium mangrovi (ex Huang et al. 2023)]|uniref:Molybdate ABC transporter substrate-binding protein n=1 Tax=Novosphingobium mangrovi (ex Huang et al. 2023) TaxID=2976432 RepID=A0ABT2I569_9SPHN|nr:molybdate ABC transporter substrate-binding protein [Novosphingobium mangrovi (ex Huang et al. 2023)]MCT2399961.1 molybdate ABC transporter substrate-binding protein [Novosphingobium mangrovi (ex Huang et al. 2023)]